MVAAPIFYSYPSMPAIQPYQYSSSQNQNTNVFQPRRMSRPDSDAVVFNTIKNDMHHSQALTDAWQPGDENLGFLQRSSLHAIQWYQDKTHYRSTDGSIQNHYYFKWLHCTCPFTPSCSSYTAQAIRKYGFFKGGLKAAFRLFFKCNGVYPLFKTGHIFNKGGVISDPA